MQRSLAPSFPCFALGGFLVCSSWVPRVLAESPWLSITPSASCSPSVQALSKEVETLKFGAQDLELSATVRFEEEISGTGITVQVLRGLTVVGTKQVSAASCDEALGAAASVLAIALSGPTEQAALAPPAVEPRSGSQDVTPFKRVRLEYDGQVPQITDYLIAETPQRLATGVRDSLGEPHPTGMKNWRASVLAGVDAGTVNASAMSLGATFSRSLGRGELRLSGSFIQPLVSTSSDTYLLSQPGLLQREVQYAVVGGVDYCLGIDRQRWLSACGGLETTLSNYLLNQPGYASPTRWAVGVGPTLGALFVLRKGLVQPELLASASLPLAGNGRLGGPYGPATVALRFAAGASLSF